MSANIQKRQATGNHVPQFTVTETSKRSELEYSRKSEQGEKVLVGPSTVLRT